MIKIKRITTKETYPIRQEVLRKGKPIESCYFANDDDTSTFHLGCFENEILKGIVSVYETQNLLFPENKTISIKRNGCFIRQPKTRFWIFISKRG